MPKSIYDTVVNLNSTYAPNQKLGLFSSYICFFQDKKLDSWKKSLKHEKTLAYKSEPYRGSPCQDIESLVCLFKDLRT